MKRRIILIALVFVFAMTGLMGCANSAKKSESDGDGSANEPKAERVDYMQVYADVLKEYYRLIKDTDSLEFDDERVIGIIEAAYYMGEEALDKIGYALKDVNGDSVPELLIGDTESFDGASENLYAVYTIKDEKPHFVLSGRSRSSYSLNENGHFSYHGSNGAAYTIFGEYALAEDGDLKCLDYYFTYEKEDGNFEDIGFYHNTTGVYNRDKADELNISDEEFWKIEEDIMSKGAVVGFTSFSELKTEENEGTDKADYTALHGSWTGYSGIDSDNEFVLVVDISSDGKVRYRAGTPESEFVVDYKGTWAVEQTGNIVFKMTDSYEGYSFDGAYEWNVSGNSLDLKHIKGDTFIYGTEGKVLSFTK